MQTKDTQRHKTLNTGIGIHNTRGKNEQHFMHSHNSKKDQYGTENCNRKIRIRS